MKRLLIAFAILAVLAMGTIASLPFLIDADRFRPVLENELTKVLGRPVRLGNLKLTVMAGSVTASDLFIAEDPAFSQKASGQQAFVSAKSVNVVIDLKKLILDRKLDVRGIEIGKPSIDMVQAASGKWNFSSLGGEEQRAQVQTANAANSTALPPLSVSKIKITGGRVSLHQPGSARPLILENVNLAIDNFSPTAAFPFTIAAVLMNDDKTDGADAAGAKQNVNISGTVGPYNTSDAARTPVDAKLKLTGIDLLRTGLVSAAQPLRGVIGFDGTAASDGKTAKVAGDLRADQVILAKRGTAAGRPLGLHFSVNHDLNKQAGVLERGDIAIGSAKAELTGRYELPATGTRVQMKLNAAAMAVSELEHILPALDVILPKGARLEGGTLNANLTFNGPTEALVTDGVVRLNDARLTGYDLGTKMTTIGKLAGVQMSPNTELKSAGATVHADSAGVALKDILVNVPAIGELSGAGTVSAAHQLDFVMRANLRANSGALAALGTGGNLGVPFSIQGTAEDPKFTADVKGMAVERLKTLQPADVGKAVDELKKLKSSDIGETAGKLIDLFGHRKK